MESKNQVTEHMKHESRSTLCHPSNSHGNCLRTNYQEVFFLYNVTYNLQITFT